MRGAWFNCSSGIAGDMALGSLIDAGASLPAIVAELRKLSVDGWTLDVEAVTRSGIAATHAVVRDDDDATSRDYAVIRDTVGSSDIATRARDRALAVFERLARAESAIHDTPLDRVHFHEVGGIDAIVDVVGTCVALELLDVESVFSSSVGLGSGTVQTAHGRVPNPAPAVVKLLEGAPTHGIDTSLEMTTPTGAAIVSALSERFGSSPQFGTLEKSGFGAGTRDLEGIANCTQVLVGALVVPEPDLRLVVVETNIDDATGEVLAHTLNRLMDAGARDAWITPILMKKGRPAHTVSAMCSGSLAQLIISVMTNETGAFGVRTYQAQRHPVARTFETVDLGDERLVVKAGPHRTKAEFDDAARIAAKTGKTVREVIAEVEK